jgi:hypothetical protein
MNATLADAIGMIGAVSWLIYGVARGGPFPANRESTFFGSFPTILSVDLCNYFNVLIRFCSSLDRQKAGKPRTKQRMPLL